VSLSNLHTVSNRRDRADRCLAPKSDDFRSWWTSTLFTCQELGLSRARREQRSAPSMDRCKVSLSVARCSGVGASFTDTISFASSSRPNRVWHARGRPDLWLEQGYCSGGVAGIFRSPAVLMNLDLRIARFAWPGMPDAAASRLASPLQSPEAFGTPTLSVMDHWRGTPRSRWR
jgi:hypothetical protein